MYLQSTVLDQQELGLDHLSCRYCRDRTFAQSQHSYNPLDRKITNVNLTNFVIGCM